MAVVLGDNLEKAFNAAVNVIKSLPKDGDFKPPPEMMLQYYANFKQATVGPCNIAKPWAFDVVAKAKWDAWNKLSALTKEEAMQNYVNELAKVYERLPLTPEREIFGSFINPKEESKENDEKDEGNNVVDERGAQEDASKDEEDATTIINKAESSTTNAGGDRIQQRIDSICSDSDEEFCDPSNSEPPTQQTTESEAVMDTLSSVVASAPVTPHPTAKEQQVVYVTDSRISQFHSDIAGKMVALEHKIETAQKLLSSVDSKVKDPCLMCTKRERRRKVSGVVNTIKNIIFPGMRWKTVIFLILWPLIVNLAIKRFARK